MKERAQWAEIIREIAVAIDERFRTTPEERHHYVSEYPYWSVALGYYTKQYKDNAVNVMKSMLRRAR